MRTLLATFLIAAAALAGCATNDDGEGGTGTVSFAITDAPTDEFQKVEVTISRVAIHRSGSGDDDATASGTTTAASNTSTATATATSTNATTSQDAGPSSGWITIVSTARTVDLLALHRNNTAETLGFADVEAGHYQQVRFYIDQVVGTRHDGSVVTMTVPSGVARTSGSFTVEAGGNTTLTAEIDLDRSIQCRDGGGNPGCTFRTHIGRITASND